MNDDQSRAAFWRTFRNYFLSAWWIAGGGMAVKLWSEGVLGVLFAYAAVAPLAAIGALAKAAYDQKHPPPPVPPRIRWLRTAAIGLVSAAIIIAAMIGLGSLLKH